MLAFPKALFWAVCSLCVHICELPVTLNSTLGLMICKCTPQPKPLKNLPKYFKGILNQIHTKQLSQSPFTPHFLTIAQTIHFQSALFTRWHHCPFSGSSQKPESHPSLSCTPTANFKFYTLTSLHVWVPLTL